MCPEARCLLESAPQGLARISYGLVDRKDIEAVTRIYLRSFPQRVNRWFQRADHAGWFYGDLMELMRLVHGRTFFVARSYGEPIGYLILTLPRWSLFPAIFGEGFFWRAMAHGIVGRYGSRLVLLTRALRGLVGQRPPAAGDTLSDSPHVYVVAVEESYTGMGIGSALIEQARSACQQEFRRLWLRVDVTNTGAVRLYQRIGFRIVRSDAFQHEMVWDFATVSAKAL